MKFASRIGRVPPYPFVEISRKIAARKADGIDVISFGIGDPDIPTPDFVVDALREAALDPPNHRYPESDGLPEFKSAVADWYSRRFGVDARRGRRGAVADRREGGHRPRVVLLHRAGRHSPGAGPRLSRIRGWRHVRRGRELLHAAGAGERLSSRLGRDSAGRRRQGHGDVAELSEQPDRSRRRGGVLSAGRSTSRGETISRSCTTRATARSATTATGRSASWRSRARRRSGSSSTRSPSPTT